MPIGTFSCSASSGALAVTDNTFVSRSFSPGLFGQARYRMTARPRCVGETSASREMMIKRR
jgi:hypothetical protein